MNHNELASLMPLDKPELTRVQVDAFIDYINDNAGGFTVFCEQYDNGDYILADIEDSVNSVHVYSKTNCIKNKAVCLDFSFPVELNICGEIIEINDDFIEIIANMLENEFGFNMII